MNAILLHIANFVRRECVSVVFTACFCCPQVAKNSSSCSFKIFSSTLHFSMVFVCWRVWRRPVCARCVSLWKSPACRASLPTTSPPRLQRWSPGTPSTTESATCSRPAAGTPGMITQRIQGNAYLLLVCLCPCYLSASLIFLSVSSSSSCIYPMLVSSSFLSSLHLWPLVLFIPPLLFSSPPFLSLCFSSFLNSFGPFLSVVSLFSFLFGLLAFTPLSFYPLQSFSPFFSDIICSSFLTSLDSSCFYSSLFSIPLCSIFKLIFLS